MVRDQFLRALVLFGAALFISTESLGLVHEIRRVPLAIFWAAVLTSALFHASRHWRRIPRFSISRDPVVLICSAGIGVILLLTAITAAVSPPNSADAMAYHMPRVVYWAAAGSVSFFPTPYFNQVMLQPFAEYLMLQTYVLSGGDHFINFVQWFASLASVVGVSAIAAQFGANARGQAFAALFCATLPSGILASSGAKNDYFMAMWLTASVYFAIRFARMRHYPDALFLGAALGFTLLTKATGYLFAPFLLAAIFLVRPRKFPAAGALCAIALALTINTPHYIRNYHLSGSIMGFDSAQGNGVYRWRNDAFGWKQTASNILRNLSDQLGAGGSAWNSEVYEMVVSAHRHLGIAIDDPSTTFRDSVYTAPLNANHEANAPNRWHLFILIGVICILIGRAFRKRDLDRALYAAAIVCAFIAFSAYLKWQSFFGRLLLPLFVLSAPLTALLGGLQTTLIPAALCLFLLNNARHPVLENWVRPLTGPQSIFHRSRDDQYFSDMTQWHNQASYLKTVDLLAHSPCATIAIDITHLQLEYPIEALLRERRPDVRFTRDKPPCAVVCLDCAGDLTRLALYRDFDRSVTVGKFVIFTLPASRSTKSPVLPAPPQPHSPSAIPLISP